MTRKPVIAGILGAVVAATVLTACGGAAPGLSARSLPAPSGTVRPPTVQKGLPRDVSAMLLPATGEDSRLTQGLDGFSSGERRIHH
ncbi:hypothetical protein XF35_40490, partial [Streptomyces platensis subsp. clarensis]|nr:hypothetical protein [Streptomyces platensis subsp. clarensis]